MLVLTRKADERITIGEGVNVVVLSIHGNRVKLGITAPSGIVIARVALDSSNSAEQVAPSTRKFTCDPG